MGWMQVGVLEARLFSDVGVFFGALICARKTFEPQSIRVGWNDMSCAGLHQMNGALLNLL